MALASSDLRLHVGAILRGPLTATAGTRTAGGACRQELARHGRSLIRHRERWRQRRLLSGDASDVMVRAPIRYGRLSASRGHTYTMVYSPEYNAHLGTAKVIRCKEPVSGIGDLASEAEELWVAESTEDHRGEICATWGCVALVIPRDFLDREDREDRRKLLKDWADRTAREPGYGKLRFSDEDRQMAGGGVIQRGRLRIPWPTPAKGGTTIPFDLLLATATNPGIPESSDYPTVKTIASAWKRNDHAYYFRCNS